MFRLLEGANEERLACSNYRIGVGVQRVVFIYVLVGRSCNGFKRAVNNPLTTILPRRRRQMLFEHPLKVRLIGKPGLQRYIGNQLAAA